MTDARKFIYLLNAFEAAAQSNCPAADGYAGKRQALLEYVEKLEGERTEALAFALRQLVYEKDGKWFTGINGDADVTDIVGAALSPQLPIMPKDCAQYGCPPQQVCDYCQSGGKRRGT